jgi:hypothetical protein
LPRPGPARCPGRIGVMAWLRGWPVSQAPPGRRCRLTIALYLCQAGSRRSWRQAMLLALLSGLLGAVALGAIAGAHRTSTAYGRYPTASNASDVVVNVAGKLPIGIAPGGHLVRLGRRVHSSRGSNLRPRLDRCGPINRLRGRDPGDHARLRLPGRAIPAQRLGYLRALPDEGSSCTWSSTRVAAYRKLRALSTSAR